MLRTRVLLTTLIIAVSFTGAAFAWGPKGHMTVARIAWNDLKDSPQQQKALFEILKHHPHFDTYLKNDKPDGATLEEWVFLQAATWPDHVRVPHGFHGNVAADPIFKFHRGPWHFVNYPYKAGQNTAMLPVPLKAQTDILKQLDLTMAILTGKTTTDPGIAADVTPAQNKAVRLCWLLHLVGDLHQPLHTAALIDDRFANDEHQDEGGNLIAIRLDNESYPIKLHSFWDQLPGTDAHFDSVNVLADRLTHDPALAKGKLSELTANTTIPQWALESYQAAASKAYLNGNLEFSTWAEFEQHHVAIAHVPVLRVAAQAHAHRIAERRLVLGGYRLAAQAKLVVAP